MPAKSLDDTGRMDDMVQMNMVQMNMVQQDDHATIVPISGQSDARQPPAWEQIETGRFMPRRTRGSFRGGVLG